MGDTSGVISTGTHYLYRSTLSGYNLIDGIYSLKSKGTGNDITLNIDSGACRAAYEALGKITGETAGEDLVNEIFSEFCMGK